MPAKVVIEHLTGPEPGEAVIVNEVRFRADDGNALNQLSPVELPHAVQTILREPVISVPGVTTASYVVLGAYFAPGDYALVGEGESSEVVEIVGNTYDTLSAVFTRSHPIGTIIRAVKAARSKVFQIRAETAPGSSLANLRVSRLSALPPGAFDQWRVVDAYAPASDAPLPNGRAVPAVSEQIAPGPWTAAGVLAMIEIQMLAAGSLKHFPVTEYKFEWDEA